MSRCHMYMNSCMVFLAGPSFEQALPSMFGLIDYEFPIITSSGFQGVRSSGSLYNKCTPPAPASNGRVTQSLFSLGCCMGTFGTQQSDQLSAWGSRVSHYIKACWIVLQLTLDTVHASQTRRYQWG